MGNVKCERCGTVFCWDDADEAVLAWDEDGFPAEVFRKLYCGPNCRVKASRKRRKVIGPQLRACLTRPERKQKFASEEDALLTAARVRTQSRRWLYPYKCPCGFWHLTSNPAALGLDLSGFRRRLA